MNLIVALMVAKMDVAEAEITLAQQRIEEISSMADISSLIKTFRKQFFNSSHYDEDTPNLVCIEAMPKDEKESCFGKFYRSWILKEHGNSGSNCREIRKFERLVKFYPRNYLVRQTVEMLRNKEKNKEKLMKEVKKIQKETQERVNKLISIVEGDYISKGCY